MAQASTIAAWVMLLLKAVALMAFIIVVISLFWAIRSRRSPQKKDDDLG